MSSSTRSKDKTETVSQSPAGLDQHCSTSGSESQGDIVEITKKLREVKLSDITKNEKELNELPPKVSSVTEKRKKKEKEGEKLQIKIDRERDGERRGEQEKEQSTRQKIMSLQGILDNWEHTIERYKKFIATSSFTLAYIMEVKTDACIDDRSLSSCIDDIKAANDSLKEEMEMKFAHLESPASTKVEKVQEVKMTQNARHVTITDNEMFCIDFKEYDDKQAATTPKDGKYLITSITELSDGKMVISGAAPGNQSHITVINSKGEIQVKHPVERRPGSKKTHRYCSNLSEDDVVTVYGTQEIAIYDVHEGKQRASYSGQNTWKTSCVAYDPEEHKIFVCYGHAKAFSFFDKELKHNGTMHLPDVDIGNVNDIAVHHDFLLVCHQKGARAITKIGLQLIFELEIPPGKVHAIGVCVDKNSFIYILWSNGKTKSLVQYSKDGRKLIINKPLENAKSDCLTTLDVDGTEHLVIASGDSGKLYSFQLIPEE